MADNGYFSHTSQDGRSPWDRAEAQGIRSLGYQDQTDVVSIHSDPKEPTVKILLRGAAVLKLCWNNGKTRMGTATRPHGALPHGQGQVLLTSESECQVRPRQEHDESELSRLCSRPSGLW